MELDRMSIDIEDESTIKRKKIAVIGIRGLPANYGGFETCAEYISKRWANEGHQVLVYCRKNHYKDYIPDYYGVRLKYTPSIRSKNLATLSHTLISIINLLVTEPQIKFVHLYNTGNAMFLPLLKLFGKKTIISGDGLEWKREKWGKLAKFIHKAGERFAVALADKIVVDNEEVKKYYEEKYTVDTALIAYGAKQIVHNPSLAEELLKKYNLKSNEYFIFVGRLVPEKGVHHLIEAYKKLGTKFPLVIIGDDTSTTPYREELLKQRSDMIRFLGFLYDDDYEQLLINSLLYVSASRLEGTSPSLLAAMGARVCALVNGIEENIATTQGCSYTFKKNDYEDLRVTWQKLIDEPRLAREMAEMGFQHVLRNYRWDAIAEQYLSVFDGLR